jgi:hypothetical protein
VVRYPLVVNVHITDFIKKIIKGYNKMECSCKICPLHVVVRILKSIATRCSAAVKALIGK